MHLCIYLQKQLCYTVYNYFKAFIIICKYNYITFTYEYLAGGFMNEITINVLPENFKPLPVIFNTACAYYNQPSTEYKGKKQDFYQILIVLDGKGTLYCNGEKYKLKKGCAFFTSIYTQSRYINNGGLTTAFLTVKGDSVPQLIEHFGWGNFRFFPSVDVELYKDDIKNIIN